MIETVAVLLLGVGAGIVSGLFGVGGGVVFVPLLTIALGLGQLEAEATSLAAMIPVVAVGAWRQSRVGLVDWRAGALLGAASIPGVLVGAWLALSLDDDELRRGFGIFLVFVAAQMAWRGWQGLQRERSDVRSEP